MWFGSTVAATLRQAAWRYISYMCFRTSIHWSAQAVSPSLYPQCTIRTGSQAAKFSRFYRRADYNDHQDITILAIAAIKAWRPGEHPDDVAEQGSWSSRQGPSTFTPTLVKRWRLIKRIRVCVCPFDRVAAKLTKDPGLSDYQIKTVVCFIHIP